MAFRSNVKKIMKDKKVTIRDAVEASGLSSATIHKLRENEGITECRLSTLGRIATALGVPVKMLFDGEWEPQEAKDTDKA